jgi:hypothetical protein
MFAADDDADDAVDADAADDDAAADETSLLKK